MATAQPSAGADQVKSDPVMAEYTKQHRESQELLHNFLKLRDSIHEDILPEEDVAEPQQVSGPGYAARSFNFVKKVFGNFLANRSK